MISILILFLLNFNNNIYNNSVYNLFILYLTIKQLIINIKTKKMSETKSFGEYENNTFFEDILFIKDVKKAIEIIINKNNTSTYFKSDDNNVVLSLDNQLKEKKDINEYLKENEEEKDMSDYKEEGKLRYNKNGTLQKKRGRKKLNKEINEEEIIHKKTDNDNIIYKLKVNCLRCIRYTLNELLIKNGFNYKIQKINGKIVKDGKKESNLEFLNKKICDIFIMKRSDKYNKNERSNESIIPKIRVIKEINKILEMPFIDFFQDIYMKKNWKEFKKEFGVKCEFLFLETTFDIDKEKNKQMKKIMSDLNEFGMIQYFNNITPRKSKKNKTNFNE